MKRKKAVKVDPDDVSDAYHGSDASLTRRVMRALEAAGQDGVLAAHLFRAEKASTRAKSYRGGIGASGPSYHDLAYGRKGDSIEKLCWHLYECLDVEWGWREDPEQSYAPWVLYVEIPSIGQVSFHALERGVGPDYPAEWDGSHASQERILAFCEQVITKSNRTRGTGAAWPGRP